MSLKNKRKKIKEGFFEKENVRQNILGLFILVIICLFVSKLVESILIDIGIGVEGKVNIFWWDNQVERVNENTPLFVKHYIKTRPQMFWIFTQFTWLTTIWLFIFVIFRFFKFSDNIPAWLRWWISPRNATFIAAYETIVCIIFWSSFFTSFEANFSPHIKTFQIVNTVIVHAVLPFLTLIYAISIQITSEKASMLKPIDLVYGMIYIMAYFCFYIIVGFTWTDPYPVTNLKEQTSESFIKMFIALIAVYILLNILLIIQNVILLKLNKRYDPKNDYTDVTNKHYKNIKKERKAFEKFNKLYPELKNQLQKENNLNEFVEKKSHNNKKNK